MNGEEKDRIEVAMIVGNKIEEVKMEVREDR